MSENENQQEERYDSDDLVNDILVVSRKGMGVDPLKLLQNKEYVERLRAWAQKTREEENKRIRVQE